MPTWKFYLNHINKWNVEKKDGSYVVTKTSFTNGVKGEMNSKPRKKWKPPCKPYTSKIECNQGQRVIAKDNDDGLYYAGTVQSNANTSQMLVKFDHGKQQTTSSYFIIPVGGAVPRPVITSTDYVLVQVKNRTSRRICYIPGIVQMVPLRMSAQFKFYSILLYNSQIATTLRCHLTKITKARFELLCKFLLDRDHIQEQQTRLSRNHRNIPRSKSVSDSSKTSFDSISRSQSSSSHSNLSQSKVQAESSVRGLPSSRSTSASSDTRFRHLALSRSKTPNSKLVTKSKPRKKQRSSSARSRSHSSTSDEILKSQSTLDSSLPRITTNKNELIDKATNTSEPVVNEDSIQAAIVETQQRQLLELQTKLTKQQESYECQQKKLRKTLRRLKSANKELLDSQNGGLNIPKIAMNDVEISANDIDTKIATPPVSKSTTSPFILALRNSLPPLANNSNVLARWSAEGWYYQGLIEACHVDSSYHVRDAVGNIERIYREDIIDPHTGHTASSKPLDIGDSVIALHPKYPYSFTPAKVIKTHPRDKSYTVEYYDGRESRVSAMQLLPLSNKKYDYDVSYIRKCENKLIGEVVVARNENTGKFQIGQVRQKLGRDARYVIKFAEGKTIIQYAPYIYSALNKRYDLAPGDYILAIEDPDTCTYLPGRITGMTDNGGLTVEFCNNVSRSDVKSAQSFWLSPQYYNDLVGYYKEKCERKNSVVAL